MVSGGAPLVSCPSADFELNASEKILYDLSSLSRSSQARRYVSVLYYYKYTMRLVSQTGMQRIVEGS